MTLKGLERKVEQRSDFGLLLTSLDPLLASAGGGRPGDISESEPLP